MMASSSLLRLRSLWISRHATSLCSTSMSMAVARTTTTTTTNSRLPLRLAPRRGRGVHSSLLRWSRHSGDPPQARPSGEVELSKLEKEPSDRFDEIEAAIHANLVNDIEAYKSNLMADHGFFERMLTSLGIKKSYTRDQTLWLCKLILVFFASGFVGIGFAKIDDRLKQLNVLLDELKGKKLDSVPLVTVGKAIANFELVRREIHFKNIRRSWAITAVLLGGYFAGYSMEEEKNRKRRQAIVN